MFFFSRRSSRRYEVRYYPLKVTTRYISVYYDAKKSKGCSLPIFFCSYYFFVDSTIWFLIGYLIKRHSVFMDSCFSQESFKQFPPLLCENIPLRRTVGRIGLRHCQYANFHKR